MNQDSLTELIDDIYRGGQPSAEWLLKWSTDEHDPLSEAWKVSVDPNAMTVIVTVSAYPPELALQCHQVQNEFIEKIPDDIDERYRQIATRIRQMVKPVPTLAKFLEGCAKAEPFSCSPVIEKLAGIARKKLRPAGSN
jgi:hypothetical protein